MTFKHPRTCQSLIQGSSDGHRSWPWSEHLSGGADLSPTCYHRQYALESCLSGGGGVQVQDPYKGMPLGLMPLDWRADRIGTKEEDRRRGK